MLFWHQKAVNFSMFHSVRSALWDSFVTRHRAEWWTEFDRELEPEPAFAALTGRLEGKMLKKLQADQFDDSPKLSMTTISKVRLATPGEERF